MRYLLSASVLLLALIGTSSAKVPKACHQCATICGSTVSDCVDASVTSCPSTPRAKAKRCLNKAKRHCRKQIDSCCLASCKHTGEPVCCGGGGGAGPGGSTTPTTEPGGGGGPGGGPTTTLLNYSTTTLLNYSTTSTTATTGATTTTTTLRVGSLGDVCADFRHDTDCGSCLCCEQGFITGLPTPTCEEPFACGGTCSISSYQRCFMDTDCPADQTCIPLSTTSCCNSNQVCDAHAPNCPANEVCSANLRQCTSGGVCPGQCIAPAVCGPRYCPTDTICAEQSGSGDYFNAKVCPSGTLLWWHAPLGEESTPTTCHRCPPDCPPGCTSAGCDDGKK